MLPARYETHLYMVFIDDIITYIHSYIITFITFVGRYIRHLFIYCCYHIVAYCLLMFITFSTVVWLFEGHYIPTAITLPAYHAIRRHITLLLGSYRNAIFTREYIYYYIHGYYTSLPFTRHIVFAILLHLRRTFKSRHMFNIEECHDADVYFACLFLVAFLRHFVFTPRRLSLMAVAAHSLLTTCQSSRLPSYGNATLAAMSCHYHALHINYCTRHITYDTHYRFCFAVVVYLLFVIVVGDILPWCYTLLLLLIITLFIHMLFIIISLRLSNI